MCDPQVPPALCPVGARLDVPTSQGVWSGHPTRGPWLKGLGRGHVAHGARLTSPGPAQDHSSLQLRHLQRGRQGWLGRGWRQGVWWLSFRRETEMPRAGGPRFASWCPGLHAEVLGARVSAAAALQTCCRDPCCSVPRLRRGVRPAAAWCRRRLVTGLHNTGGHHRLCCPGPAGS